jgi:5-methylcytosine-specific restriction endonuclease McrBC GTP-binding regulatory subunit McrB
MSLPTSPSRQHLKMAKVETDRYEGQWAIVQFHPAYNYEDFVRGIQVSGQDEKIKYENVQRIFSAMCIVSPIMIYT